MGVKDDKTIIRRPNPRGRGGATVTREIPPPRSAGREPAPPPASAPPTQQERSRPNPYARRQGGAAPESPPPRAEARPYRRDADFEGGRPSPRPDQQGYGRQEAPVSPRFDDAGARHRGPAPPGFERSAPPDLSHSAPHEAPQGAFSGSAGGRSFDFEAQGRAGRGGDDPPDDPRFAPRSKDPFEHRETRLRDSFVENLKEGSLLHLASDTLLIGFEISNQQHDPGIDNLRASLQELIINFLQSGRASGLGKEQVDRAGYVLCAYLDEQVMATPWGGASDWGIHPLLVEFYHDALGGERFFEILEDAKKRSGDNIELLELQYYCMAFGFEGDYKLGRQGELEKLRNDLYAQIRRYRKDPQPELSIHWEGIENPRKKMSRRIPGWVYLSFASVVLTIMYMIFNWKIDGVQLDMYEERLTKVSASPVKLEDVENNPWTTWTEVERSLPKDDQRTKDVEVDAPPPVAKPPVDNIFIKFVIRGSELNDAYRDEITYFYQELQAHQNRERDRLNTFVLEVTGRASPVGPAEYNRQLSRERARSVANFLAELDAANGLLEFARIEGIGADDLLEPPEGEDFNNYNQSVQVFVTYQK